MNNNIPITNTDNKDADTDNHTSQFKEKYLPELNRHQQQEKSTASKRRFSVPNRHRSKSRTEDSSDDNDDDHSSSSKDDITRSRKTFSLSNLKRSSSPSKTRGIEENSVLRKTRSLPSTPRDIHDSLEDRELDEQSIKKSISSMLNMNGKRRGSDKRPQTDDASESLHDGMTSIHTIKKHLKRKSASDSTRYSIEHEIDCINEKTDKILILCAHLVKISNTNIKKMNKRSEVEDEGKLFKESSFANGWCSCCCCCFTQSPLLINSDDRYEEYKDDEYGKTDSFTNDKGNETLMTESSSNQTASSPSLPKSTNQPYFPMRQEEEEVKDNDYYPEDHPIHTCTIQ